MAERDAGNTLLEVLVTAILLGIITSVVAFAVTTTLRVTPVAESGVDEARSLSGLASRFPADVSSAPGSTIKLSSFTPLCDGAGGPGIDLVQLTWSQDGSPSTDFVVVYRYEPKPPGHVVRRYICTGPLHDDTSRSTLTSPLSATPPTTELLPAPPAAPQVVRMQLVTLDGTDIVVEGTPRDAAATLPTTTTSPTVPLPPCAFAFNDAPYGPINHVDPADPTTPYELESSPPTELTVGGTGCGDLTLVYDTGNAIITQDITVINTVGSVAIPHAGEPDSEQWTAGTKFLEVHENGVPSGVIAEFEVTAP